MLLRPNERLEIGPGASSVDSVLVARDQASVIHDPQGASFQKRKLSQPEMDETLLWRDAIAVFANELLPDVLKELQRYSAQQLIIEDHSLDGKRISGSVTTANIAGMLLALSTFGVVALPPDPSDPDPKVIRLVRGARNSPH
jgi:ferric-dicitrate binding protein FerR (iron transport regulator)